MKDPTRPRHSVVRGAHRAVVPGHRFASAALALLALSTAPRLHAADLDEAHVYPGTQPEADAAPAGPTENEASFTTRRFVLQGRTGFATSVGLLGVLGEFNLHDRLAINAGIGTNLYGWSPALGLRVRPVIVTSNLGTPRSAAFALTFEGSLSRAAFGEAPGIPSYCVDSCQPPSPRLHTRYVNWAQLELGFEMRAAERYQFLGSLGGARMLGNPTFTCTRQSTGESFDCSHDTRVTPRVLVITFAVGYAF